MTAPLEVMGHELAQCPKTFIGDDAVAVRDVIDAAHYLAEGAGWPNPGGWGDQPAALIEAWQLVRATEREMQERVRKGGL